MDKKEKKAQVTIFIIIALIIIVGIFLFFIIRGRIISKQKSGLETGPIYSFVVSCIEEESYNAIYLIGQQGGYYIPNKDLSTEYGIPYYIIQNKSYMPTKKDIENEISNYVDENLNECFNNFRDFPDFNIKVGEFNTLSRINQEDTIVQADFSLTAIKGESSFTISEFEEVKIPVRLGHIYDAVVEIEEQQLEYGYYVCLSCIINSAEENDLIINMMDYGYHSKIFEIVDEESEIFNESYKFLFANLYGLGE